MASKAMDALRLARAFAVGRTAVGAALLVAPGMARAWVGEPATRPGGKVLTRALGMRDLALGVGLLRAVGEDREVGRWLGAGVLADGADLAATLLAWERLPSVGRVGVTAAAASGLGLGLGLAWIGRSARRAGAHPAGRGLGPGAEVPRPC